MSDIVTIKAAANTRKFFTTATQFQNVTTYDQQGKPSTTTKAAGPFKGQKMPNSRQMPRPQWSSGKRKWMLRGFEENSKELNEIVAGCKLKYPKKHPKEGQYITEADLYDFDDAFFIHTKLYLLLKEGDESLDKKRPFDMIRLAGLQADRRFADGEVNNPYLAAKVKYQITDNTQQKKAKSKARIKEFELMKLFEGLSRKKKLTIATAMRVNVGKDIEQEDLDEIIWNIAKDTNSVSDDRVSKQDMFIRLCKMKTEDLNLLEMIGKAVKKNIIRKTKTGYQMFGQPVGNQMKKIETYLKDPANQEMYIRLEEAVNQK